MNYMYITWIINQINLEGVLKSQPIFFDVQVIICNAGNQCILQTVIYRECWGKKSQSVDSKLNASTRIERKRQSEWAKRRLLIRLIVLTNQTAKKSNFQAFLSP